MRFELLDGFRGVAALIVLVFHVVLNAHMKEALPFGGLAVDFFFCLSGFVICHSYERRLLAGLPVVDFMKIRLIRLYPMIFFGLIFGLIWLIARILIQHQYEQIGPGLATFAVNGVLLPSPFMMMGEDAAWPLNGAHWSLTFEMLANIAYAVLLFRLRGWSFGILLFFSAAVLFAAILSRGTYDVGWRLHQFHLGCIRAAFPFLAGVAVCRMRERYFVGVRIKPAYGLLLVLGLVVFLALPSGLVSPLTHASVFALIVSPALVLLGSLVVLGERSASMCEVLGRLSFPIYAVHQPILKLVYLAHQRLSSDSGDHWVPALLGMLVSIVVAWVLLRWLDEPAKSLVRSLFFKSPAMGDRI